MHPRTSRERRAGSTRSSDGCAPVRRPGKRGTVTPSCGPLRGPARGPWNLPRLATTGGRLVVGGGESSAQLQTATASLRTIQRSLRQAQTPGHHRRSSTWKVPRRVWHPSPEQRGPATPAGRTECGAASPHRLITITRRGSDRPLTPHLGWNANGCDLRAARRLTIADWGTAVRDLIGVLP